MKIAGVLVILAGWLIAVLGLNVSSLGGKYALAILGIAMSLFGILGILNKAHLKDAIWKA